MMKPDRSAMWAHRRRRCVVVARTFPPAIISVIRYDGFNVMSGERFPAGAHARGNVRIVWFFAATPSGAHWHFRTLINLSTERGGVLRRRPRPSICRIMKKRSRTASSMLPVMMAQLTAASWETIYRRTMMMAQSTCSAAEYRRMVTEKATAMRLSGTALAARKGGAAALAPFLSRARGNAKRLRRKG